MPPKTIPKTKTMPITTRQTYKKDVKLTQQSFFDFEENDQSNENIWNIMKKIHDSQVFISKQNDDIILKLENLTKENDNLRKNQEIDRSSIRNLTTEVDELKYQLGEIEQKVLNKNININGLPQLNEEEQVHAIIKIANELNFNLDNSEITKITKMKKMRTRS